MEMNNIKPKDRSERVCACIYTYIYKCNSINIDCKS